MSTQPTSEDWIGRSFGPYRIVREIGRGGMGLVFEAIRDDDEYRKTVALKVTPWYLDSAVLQERLRVERQILATLEHPNIARFLDGGTEGGAPYFVMEYVAGQPITSYCAQHRLDPTARLRLFQRVCAAVHFAHEHLVVHRDLKPANILVDADGAPKLLDFGIAKVLHDGVETSMTQAHGHAPSTLDYASPEQVRSGAVTVRTDVYSLGLVLYELLTGEPAQRADTSSPAAIERSICDAGPAAPSVRASAAGDRSLARWLRHDLDTIVMTALAKEPAQRYGSVSALSDDLERFMTSRPIHARPATLTYRVRRFIGRHGRAVAALALVVTSAGIGMASTMYQARLAERRFSQVRTLANTFVFDIYDDIERVPGTTEASKMIVQTALIYLENLRREAEDDAGLARELAAAYERIGDVRGHPLHTNLGDPAGALQSYEQASVMLTALAEGGDRDARRQLLSVLNQSAGVRQAQGDMKGAMVAYTRARELGDGLQAETPGERRSLRLLANVYSNISRASYEMFDTPASVAAARRAGELARQLVALDPGNPEYRDYLASGYNSLARIMIATGELADAAEAYRESIRIREALIAEHPDNTAYRRNQLIGYGSLGDILGYRAGENLGDVEGAAAAYAKATEMAEWARQRDPADRRAIFDLANTRVRLGGLLATTARDLPQALRELQEADRLNGGLLREDPTSDRFRYFALGTRRRIGEVLAALGRAREAVAQLEQVRADTVEYLKTPDGAGQRRSLVLVLLSLARLRAEAGETTAAAALAESLTVEARKGPFDVPAAEALTYGDLGRLFEQLASVSSGNERAEHLRAAVAHWQTGVERWQDPKVAKAMWARRDADVARLRADVERVNRHLNR